MNERPNLTETVIMPDDTLEMAQRANEARDNLLRQTEGLKALELVKGRYGVRVPKDIEARADAEHQQALKDFRMFRDGAGALIDAAIKDSVGTGNGDAVANRTQPSVQEKPSGQRQGKQETTKVSAWVELANSNPERKRLADKIAHDMAEAYGLNENDIILVKTTGKHGKEKFVLVDASVDGMDILGGRRGSSQFRSWESIMSEKNDDTFKFQSEGRSYDIREGMTKKVYQAMIETCGDLSGRDMPDSKYVERLFKDLAPFTLLTGEKSAIEGEAPTGYVDADGEVHFENESATAGQANVHFRPTAVVPDI